MLTMFLIFLVLCAILVQGQDLSNLSDAQIQRQFQENRVQRFMKRHSISRDEAIQQLTTRAGVRRARQAAKRAVRKAQTNAARTPSKNAVTITTTRASPPANANGPSRQADAPRPNRESRVAANRANRAAERQAKRKNRAAERQAKRENRKAEKQVKRENRAPPTQPIVAETQPEVVNDEIIADLPTPCPTQPHLQC